MAGLCSGKEEYYCQPCVDATTWTHCDDLDCDVHWGLDWYKCEGCQKFIDGDHETGDVGEICLDRGCYCSNCWDEQESLEKCRKKGCEMCATLYEIEIEDWWKCQACNERKPDVDESNACGDCRKEETIEELMKIVTE
jgi:hypothetical protein